MNRREATCTGLRCPATVGGGGCCFVSMAAAEVQPRMCDKDRDVINIVRARAILQQFAKRFLDKEAALSNFL